MSPVLQAALSEVRPFPGLRPFGYPDHEFFFGRQEQIYALYRLVDRNRFVAVVGSSGSGKSSLVRAGLLPLLDTETRGSGGRSWLSLEMRPGDAPLRRLTNLLSKLSSDGDPIIASARRERIALHLRRSSFGISEALDEIGGPAGTALVLVVDQFEELFRFASSGVGTSARLAAEARARDEAAQFVQLLLEASRARTHEVHVLLTMRSDFIGECARFHDLPEVVSASQFLVPSLTRDQLEEVICEPVKKVGATIEPELVERLLNDCGSDSDQLPVLQHCLLRLWEKAGRAPPAAVSADARTDRDAESDGKATHSRAVILEHYREVGGFAGALSNHADEILRHLLADRLQLAVEQTFRALSELDKEGRAVRRALRLSQLCLETGIDEYDLRKVLDRFRADDCSFLVPSFSDTPVLTDDTRIDVGHEALLRRWERVSGRGAEIGWLRAEQQDGERYHGLLSMAEDEGATLPPNLADERWSWWNSRPRTTVWAERYGGGIERVQRLLRASRARRQITRIAMAASFLVVAGLAGAMYLLWEQAKTQGDRALANYEIALNATKDSVAQLSSYLDSGAISVKGARAMLDQARDTLEKLKLTAETQSPELIATGTRLLLSISDATVTVGNNDEALRLARTGMKLSQQLVAQEPGNASFQRLVYASAFRIGDALANNGADGSDQALQEYRTALAIAQRFVIDLPDNSDWKRDLVFILTKIGDISQAKGDFSDALVQYRQALQIRETMAANDPDNLEYKRDVAAIRSRIGQILQARRDYEGALKEYGVGLLIQTALVEKSAENDVFWSNLAVSHRRIGEAFKLQKKYDESLESYESAVEIRRKLATKDPGNAVWRSGLATDNMNIGDVYMRKGDAARALPHYREAQSIHKDLAFKDSEQTTWKRNLAESHSRVAEALAAQKQIDGAIEEFRTALAIRAELAKRTSSGSARWRELFLDHLKVGDLVAQRGDHQVALQEYGSALEIARQAIGKIPESTVWRDRFASASEKIAARSALFKESAEAHAEESDPNDKTRRAFDDTK